MENPKLEPSLAGANLGAVVLCGGQSTRLGRNKSELLLHEKTFLQTIVETLSPLASHIALVGNVDTSKHTFPTDVTIVGDELPNCGPLEGIRVGLKTLESHGCEFAFVTSCDVPLLNRNVVGFLWSQLDGHDAVIPFRGDRRYGMTAIYRTSLHNAIKKRIQAGLLRVRDFTDGFDVVALPTEYLRAADPELDSLTNVNAIEDYNRLLKRIGEE